MPIDGQVFDLKVVTSIGPWSDTSQRHPGLIVSQALLSGRDSPIVVVPMTGTPQISRPTHVELTGNHGSLSGPMWILCEYPMTLSALDFQGLQPRGALPAGVRAAVRNKLAWYLRLPIAQAT